MSDIHSAVCTVRRAIGVITQGRPFNIEVMESLPIWRTDIERAAVTAAICVYGIDLKNGMAILQCNEVTQ